MIKSLIICSDEYEIKQKIDSKYSFIPLPSYTNYFIEIVIKSKLLLEIYPINLAMSEYNLLFYRYKKNVFVFITHYLITIEKNYNFSNIHTYLNLLISPKNGNNDKSNLLDGINTNFNFEFQNRGTNGDGKFQNLKIVFFGEDSVGKTSIINKFFLNNNEIYKEKPKPTIYYEIKNYTDNFINESIVVFDLGGQEIYRRKNLTNPVIFKKIFTVFLIIDIHQTNKIEKRLKYIKKFIETSYLHNTTLAVNIFLHKFDTLPHSVLISNGILWLEGINSIFPQDKPNKKFVLTTIFNNTANYHLSSVLLNSLPTELFISYFLTELIEIIVKLKGEPLYKRILKKFLELGNGNGQDVKFSVFIINEFILYVSRKRIANKNLENFGDKEKRIKIRNQDDSIILDFKCPFIEIDKNFADKRYCNITDIIIRSLTSFFSKNSSEMMSSTLLDNTDRCMFKIYKKKN